MRCISFGGLDLVGSVFACGVARMVILGVGRDTIVGKCRCCSGLMPPTETMKAVLMPPTGASRPVGLVKPERKIASDDDPQVRQQKKVSARLGHDEEAVRETALSPRVRRRLSNAKESASIFSMVCEQGEVIQWMTACHPDLTAFGRDLERRGYRTLSSIAFLTDEDVDSVADPDLRQLLLTTLSRLRHELFRM